MLVAAACARPPADDRPLPVAGGVRFRVAAPQAKAVALVGTFNGWDPAATPLEDRDGDGVWEAVVALPSGRHEYMFLVDGVWTTPPGAPQLVEDGFGRRNGLLVLE